MKRMIDKDMLEALGQMMDSKLGQALEPIKQDLAEVKQRTTKIEFTLEHDVSKQFKLLGEGQQMVIDKFQKLDQVADDVEEIKVKVTALEEVTRSNTSQIRELKIAK